MVFDKIKNFHAPSIGPLTGSSDLSTFAGTPMIAKSFSDLNLQIASTHLEQCKKLFEKEKEKKESPSVFKKSIY
jgi:hypothetical protein